MKLIVRQLELPLTYREQDVKEAITNRLGITSDHITSFEIIRRSLDTRPRRNFPVYVTSAEVLLQPGTPLKKNLRDVEPVKTDPISSQPDNILAEVSQKRLAASGLPRPVVVGAGPAGLMAALQLSLMGFKPVLIEKGVAAEERKQFVNDFWLRGSFIENNNVLFGEGGAGLFSDGKLTARSKDRPRMRMFFETLVRCGAPREILIDSEPHLGSDKLLEIVPAIRRMIEANGGDILFEHNLNDIIIEKNRLVGIKAGKKEIETAHLVLATGHSARDVYRLLGKRNISMEPKPLAVGVRLEIPQSQVNLSQYGRFLSYPGLGAASFRLTRKPEKGLRACYSFCMCPGGVVIACASEDGALTTNGMSFSSRSGHWGNAAFIVPVSPEDFADCRGEFTEPALAGLNFQSNIEKAAFSGGGANFQVPALMLEDFLNHSVSQNLPENRSCPRSRPADFDSILPDFVCATLRNSIPAMLKELNAAEPGKAIIYAAETRSSSPIRILRTDDGQALGIKGIFPAGEGAGHAGGIVSSAIDGLRAAELLIESIKKT